MSELAAGVDWAALHHRVDAVRAAIEHAGVDTSRKQRILRERAAALAAPAAAPLARAEVVDLLTFALAHERYALDLTCVREVMMLRTFTPLPCTPAFVFGLINVRGQVLSVLDARRLFVLPAAEPAPQAKIVLLQGSDTEFGLLVDSVAGVTALRRAAIAAPPPGLTGAHVSWVRGVTPERLVVLDGNAMLGDSALRVQEQVEG